MKYTFYTRHIVSVQAFTVLLIFLTGCLQMNPANDPDLNSDEGYDEPGQAVLFEKLRTHDPLTGEVPTDKMWNAVMQTKQLKDDQLNTQNFLSALTWVERGSNSDAVGPSNGNTRANSGVTSGRIDAICVDKADVTGKTVWVGGRGGGLWKTTDITVAPATWTLVNDYMINLSIAGITQDPGNNDILYMCTGESFNEAGALRGNGVFKSTDHGVTWSQLASTTGSNFFYCTRILCDNLGNVYLGTNTGIYRSTDGGATFTSITPSGLSSNAVCDIGISTTAAAGRLHVVFGIQSTRSYRFTDIPVTVAVGTWTSPTSGFPAGTQRAEIDVVGSTLYCAPSSSSQISTIYKSTDGGANWVTAGSAPVTATGDPFANGQGWYNVTVAINPSNSSECIIGGIDNAKTTNGGTTWIRISDWVFTTGQYVHADQHASVWYDGGNKLLFGSDGGIFYSSNGGTTIRDRNVNLRLKQFYAVAIHPTTTNYFLAGAQDNGTHQFNNAGLSGSIEVFGGDGAYVAIDQNQPQYQTGAYVYSNYRRSTDGGATWIFPVANNNNGLFINPYDYDNVNNRVYASYTPGNYLRWSDPQSGFTYTAVPMAAFGGQYVGAVHVSPYTANRVYFGMASGGKIIRVDGADASPVATDISTGLPTGSVYMNCINTGSSDANLVACYSNYATGNIWVSTNSGTSWTNVDGNLPDMPVYWAVYHPDNNSKMFIATETGVWETDLLNGASTVWTANATFPTARATMLKYRSLDRTLAASSYGRGLWTSVIPSVNTPDIQFATAVGSSTEITTSTSGCRGYTDYTSSMHILNPPTGSGSATVTLSIAGGGTATQGVDYDITTNGSFVAPSMTLSFAVGVTTPQPFTIRIYDDAAIESAESFTLNYSLAAGSTNAQIGASNQTMTYTISDNDAVPVLPSGSTQTIGTLTYDLIQVSDDPLFNSRLQSKRVQLLYKASELTAAGLTAGPITAMSFYIGVKSSTRAFTNLTIKMGGTTTANLVNVGYTVIGGLTTVKNAFTYSTIAGYNNFTFDAAYTWNGTDNLVIEVCYDNVTAAPSQVSDHTIGYSDGSVPAIGNMFWQDNINCSGTFGSVTYFGSGIKPTIKLTVSVTGTPVSTALSSTKTAYLGPNDDVYYYDGSGNILARIKNLTAFDYGCTQIIIDRAGSTSAQFWNVTAANNLLSKSIKVIPANNTSTGSYQVTLYYTAAEVAGWEAATGRTWAGSAMQVVKVSNGFFIPDVTAAVPHTADVSMVTGTKGTLGTNFTIRGDFSSTGFSGFGVGVPGNAILTSDFITKASGNFTDGTKWQYNNEAAGYADALQAPSSNNNVTIQAAHTIALDAGFTINTGKTLTVNGTLNCGTNTISGAGSFVTSGASTLGIGSTAGITASAATGNIQTSTRTFSTSGNYTYNGAASQAAGNGLPATINNLVIANTGIALNNIVSMGGPLSVNGSSTLTSGILSIGSNTLTLNGTVSGSGTLTGTASGGVSTSNLVIGGAALNQLLNFTQTSVASRSLNNLTLNSGSSATLGNALDVYGTIALTAATLNMASKAVTLKSNINTTARLADINTSTLSNADNVTVERFVGAAIPKSSWRLLTAPLRSTTGSNGLIWNYWQNGGVNTAGLGTQVTGPGGASTTTGIDAWTVRPSVQYFDHTVDQNLHPVTDTKQTGTATPLFTQLATAANKSYFIFVRGDRFVNPGDAANNTTFAPTGTLQTGDQTFVTASTNPDDNTIVGNPYASPVDLALFRAANLGSNTKTNYYYWDPYLTGSYGFGGYVTVSYDGIGNETITPVDAVNHTRFLQSGQAMFLERSASGAGTASVTFKENQKGATNVGGIFLTSGIRPDSMAVNLNVLVSNAPILVDGIIAAFDNDYAAAVDDYDATKFTNIGESVSFKRDGKALAIERRPLPGTQDTLFLNMSNMKAGNSYRFEFAPGFTAPTFAAFLQDSYVPGSNYPLSITSNSTFDFNVTADAATAVANRFRIVFVGAGPLAVSFKTVKAYEQNHNINVEWKVDNEMDMKQYEVEKSTDGSSFVKIYTTAALNQTTVAYSWLDVNPVAGYNFYRIRSIALSGEIKYSSIVKVLIGKGTPGIVIYPNPATDGIVNLQMNNMPAGTYSIRLINVLGQVVQTMQLKHAVGNSTESVPLSNQLSKGVYNLEIIKPDNSRMSIKLQY